MSVYIYSKWKNSPAGFPSEFYSELDASRYETRKVEIFSAGKMTYASKQKAIAPTRLGIVPVPSLGEISSQSDFSIKEISKQDFEEIWAKATK
ncbi:hypothetical protein HZU77_010155 [Neisseriaceae bacterium TC5R-5]|nr:hypothetical protein [Neisseriaceae bacterium TC5R-5]